MIDQNRKFCKNGHPWIPENIYEYNGRKSCIPCHSEATVASNKRIKETNVKLRKAPPLKTHCPNGHLRTPENSRKITTDGKSRGFRCLDCYQIWYSKKKDHQKAYRLMK